MFVDDRSDNVQAAAALPEPARLASRTLPYDPRGSPMRSQPVRVWVGGPMVGPAVHAT